MCFLRHGVAIGETFFMSSNDESLGSFFLKLAVVGLFVLLVLLVVVVVAVNRQFAALAGRIAVLEAGESCLVLAGSPLRT